jgi:threonine/homoserine/homoserine lactone efflux protein
MFDPVLFSAFLVASAVVIVAPGPDLLLVAAQSIGRGRRHGMVAAAGTCSGLLVHSTAAVLGLSSLFVYAPLAFEAVRWTGVAYLAWLAFRTLRSSDPLLRPGAPAGRSGAREVYRQAFLTNVLNPKVAVFFIAFLPQFATPGGLPLPLQIAMLAAVFVLLGLAFLLVFASLCARFGDLLRDRPSFVRLQRWFMATAFGGLALWLAVQRR